MKIKALINSFKNWLNSDKRKNWQIIVLNLTLTLFLSFILIPLVVNSYQKLNKRSFTFEGIILNLKDEPIKNAKIILEGIDVKTTDQEGKFKIQTKKELLIGDLITLEIIPPEKEKYKKYKEKFEVYSLNMNQIKINLKYEK